MSTLVKKASNRIISVDIDRDARTITWNVAGAGKTQLRIDKCSDDTRDYAMYHGFKQSASDPAALPAGASPREKLDAIIARIETLESVGWSAEIQIVDVIATVKNIDRPTARAWWDSLDATQQKAVRRAKSVVAEIDRRRGGDAAMGDTLLDNM